MEDEQAAMVPVVLVSNGWLHRCLSGSLLRAVGLHHVAAKTYAAEAKVLVARLARHRRGLHAFSRFSHGIFYIAV